MLRIVALNEVQEKDLEEEHVSREAEETIAISEYTRALELKQAKKTDIALSLFLELLDTQVIHDASPDNVESKLSTVKYNCHRNIAFIYEEQGENLLALQHLLKAISIDEGDVFTIYKMGKMALVVDQAEVAKMAFEKCLAKNPNHWLSLDGMIQALCLSESVSEAYGMALYCHKRDPKYQRAIDVLTEISQRFVAVLPFFETLWEGSFEMDETRKKRVFEKSCFPVRQYEVRNPNEGLPVVDFSHFWVEKPDWLTVGNAVLNLYDYITGGEFNLCFFFDLEDIVNVQPEKLEAPEEIVETETSEPAADVEAAPLQTDVTRFLNKTATAEDSAVADSESETNSKDPTADPKPKNRRRCSDLTFLEQWGWHKNRRSSRKKSKEDPAEEVDTTVSGFLKRIMPNYFVDMFEADKAPFYEVLDDFEDPNLVDVKQLPAPEVKPNTIEEFQTVTAAAFHTFLDELKSQNFDLIHIIYKWLLHICQHSADHMPSELRAVYLRMFKLHARHSFLENLLSLQLSDEEFATNYCMMLFDLELEMDALESGAKDAAKRNEISPKFRRKMDLMKFYTGFMMSDPAYDGLMARMLWLCGLIHKYDNELDFALNFLYKVASHLEGSVTVKSIARVNMVHDSYFDAVSVRKLITCFERNIRINNLKHLYDNEDYPKLADILSESLINVDVVASSSSISHITVQTQIEILLEALWSTDRVEECLSWCEKALFYSVNKCVVYHYDSGKYKEWGANINFILTYLDALVKEHGSEVLSVLDQSYSARLVQTLSKIVSNQLDIDPASKAIAPKQHCVETAVPWILLHQILQKVDDRAAVARKALKENELSNEEADFLLPVAISMLFTAHDSLGRRQWCTKDNGRLLLYILDVVVPPLRSPWLEKHRDIISEYLEQITYCLYGFPTKKARLRHIEEHDAKNIELSWERGIQLFSIYRPDHLPEFDSYKFNSISAEMEGLCQRILCLMPPSLDFTASSVAIRGFINGTEKEIDPEPGIAFPTNIDCIYYLLADYYFKSRDFVKAIKYYILDLTMHPTRFDSWANLALSKASKIETKLNSCLTLNVKQVLDESDQVFRCFEQCLLLNPNHTLLRIEFGSFAYIVNSFCSRNLKLASDTLSMEMFELVEKKKDQCFDIAHQCFSAAIQAPASSGDDEDSDEETQDERWLFYYMLGKIAEKRKEAPEIWLEVYTKSAKTLYESNATYPIKINHSSPSNLSIEALEIYYRISSGIIKYLEQHATVTKKLLKYFNKVLKELSTSPFAINRAKVNDNALKRKMNSMASAEAVPAEEKKIKLDEPVAVVASTSFEETPEITITVNSPSKQDKPAQQPVEVPAAEPDAANNPSVQIRRESQESAATNPTTNGTTSNSSSSSSSSSSDTSSSDSETETSSDEEDGKDKMATQDNIDAVLKICLKNLEECVTRFPEHYKSVYRLVYHYLNAPGVTKSIEKSKQLLTGTYKTALGNLVNGLFFERKNNNFFNGIWRIPSSEIDRPGNFTSHLTKCVIVLMEVLKQTSDYAILFDLALNLHRIPDNDKKYLKDAERKELFNQATTLCLQALRNLLKKYVEEKNDEAVIELMKEIFKTYRKCSKYMQIKESAFSSVLVDTYKSYVDLRQVKVPDNANHLDLATKLCLQELNVKKNQPVVGDGVTVGDGGPANVAPSKPAAINIPGLAKPRARVVQSKAPSSTSNPLSTSLPAIATAPNVLASTPSMAALMAIYNNSPLLAPVSQMSDAALHLLLGEYYKMGLNAQTNCAMFNQPIPNIASLFGGSLPSLKGASSPSSSPSSSLLKGMPSVSITPTVNKPKKPASAKSTPSTSKSHMVKNPYSIPTDLPKSLSITRAPMAVDPPPAHHKSSVDKAKRDIMKMQREKLTKKIAAAAVHPYTKHPSQASLFENLASGLTITPQLNNPSAASMSKYPSTSSTSASSAKSFLDAYQRQIIGGVLETMPKNRKPKSQQPKRSSTLPSLDLTRTLASVFSHPSEPSLNLGSSPMPYVQNMARPTSVPSAAHMSPYSSNLRQTLTPPTLSSTGQLNTSPTKTLQQKLAERQQKNQQQKSATPPVASPAMPKNKGKGSNDDIVIVLDE